MTAPDYPTELCRSCSAAIIWARSPQGRSVPVDATPDLGGSITLESTPGGLLARVVKPGHRSGLTLYRSHFATCPQAGQWRRPRT